MACVLEQPLGALPEYKIGLKIETIEDHTYKANETVSDKLTNNLLFLPATKNLQETLWWLIGSLEKVCDASYCKTRTFTNAVFFSLFFLAAEGGFSTYRSGRTGRKQVN